MTDETWLVELDRLESAFLQGLLHTWRANFRPEPSERVLALILKIERAAKGTGVDGTEDNLDLEKAEK